MIRVFLFFLAVAAIAIGAAWLADRPGSVILNWQGWRIETSLVVLVLAAAAVACAIMLLWSLVRWVVDSPAHMSDFFRARRRDKGLRALSRGMIATGAGDARAARQHAAEARRLMRGEPMALLLEAQSAQLAGDRKAARRAFEAMLKEPGTELLALRGLYMEALRSGDHPAARTHATQAVARAPTLTWAGTALLDFQTRDGDWPAALASVRRNADNAILDKAEAKRLTAVLLTAEALEIEDDDPDTSLVHATEAHRLAPDLVPAAVVAGRLNAAAGNIRTVVRIVEKTWKLMPHPDLAEVYAHARPGDSARDRLKRVQTLAGRTPNNPEGAIAVAGAAVEGRDWALARKALEGPLRGTPTQRVCHLMARIEHGENGDAGRVREWLARALRAPRDPAWVADGYVSDRWMPASPVTGRLDAFEWTAPPAAIAPPLDDDSLFEAPPAPPVAVLTMSTEAQDVPAPDTPAPASDTASADTASADAAPGRPAADDAPAREATSHGPDAARAPSTARPDSAGTPADDRSPAAERGAQPVRPAVTPLAARPPHTPVAPPESGDRREAAIALPRPPDDPGPDGADDGDGQRRLY